MRSGLQWIYSSVEGKRVEGSSGRKQVVTSFVNKQRAFTTGVFII